MTNIDEVSRAIGALQVQVSNLAHLMEENNEVTKDTKDKVGRLETDVKAIKSNMDAMRPVVEKVKKWEQRVIGVSAVVSGGIALIATTGILGKVKEWFA